MKGTMSQNFDIGPSFYFTKSRKIIMKNFPVFDIKSKLGHIYRNSETWFPPNKCFEHVFKL